MYEFKFETNSKQCTSQIRLDTIGVVGSGVIHTKILN